MNDLKCISHPQKININSWKSQGGQIDKGSGKLNTWKSKEFDTINIVSFTLNFDENQFFNCISIKLNEDNLNNFPSKFRFEFSNDGKTWEPLIQENNFKIGPNKIINWNFSLINANQLKLVMLVDKKTQNGKYFISVGEVQVLISGVVKIRASSELDRLWVKENIIDKRNEYGWSSTPKLQKENEFLEIDLGAINRVTELCILSKDDFDTFFPSSFRILYSDDNIAWHLLLEESDFIAEPSTWYKWRFLPVSARFFQIIILEGARTTEGKYISQIIEIEIYANTDYLEKTPQIISYPPMANVLKPGIVKLAKDGENKEGVVVQGNDKRLLEATTTRLGIVELAADGEVNNSKVVTSSDKRLKYASEELSGIVKLARDGESRAGFVVQSNDIRLKQATEDKVGLVELASDGETKAGVVVQGSDSRLKHATTKTDGIVKLAVDGSEEPNVVIQGNDSRLKKATTVNFGLMCFARHNEETADKSIQSNDPRVRKATTENYGIVTLAKNLEVKEGKVVQSNDKRLTEASSENFGIVRLASLGSGAENRVVQANDPRLSDARKPINHEHDYAPKDHDFNSHKGVLKIKSNLNSTYKGNNVPIDNYASIVGVNQSGAGVIGQGGKEGVVGIGLDCGVGAFGKSEGVGVLATSKNNTAGQFISENYYGVVAGGEIKEKEIQSSKLALLTNGLSRFNSEIYSFVNNGCIACYLNIKENEKISDGDLLVINEDGKGVSRSSGYGNSRIIGVAVSNAAIVLNAPEDLLPNSNQKIKGPYVFNKPQDKVLVAVGGIAEVSANAEQRAIKAGDLLVSSLDNGYAEVLNKERYKIGIVFGKSLTSLEKGRGKIKVILSFGI